MTLIKYLLAYLLFIFTGVLSFRMILTSKISLIFTIVLLVLGIISLIVAIYVKKKKKINEIETILKTEIIIPNAIIYAFCNIYNALLVLGLATFFFSKDNIVFNIISYILMCIFLLFTINLFYYSLDGTMDFNNEEKYDYIFIIWGLVCVSYVGHIIYIILHCGSYIIICITKFLVSILLPAYLLFVKKNGMSFKVIYKNYKLKIFDFVDTWLY